MIKKIKKEIKKMIKKIKFSVKLLVCVILFFFGFLAWLSMVVKQTVMRRGSQGRSFFFIVTTVSLPIAIERVFYHCGHFDVL